MSLPWVDGEDYILKRGKVAGSFPRVWDTSGLLLCRKEDVVEGSRFPADLLATSAAVHTTISTPYGHLDYERAGHSTASHTLGMLPPCKNSLGLLRLFHCGLC